MKPLSIICFVVIILCFPLLLSSSSDDPLVRYLSARAVPLHSASDLDELVHMAGSRRLALLGEASHGTHEYYIWRDSLSRRLISEKGYNFIAVEGDWASIYELNRYVKNLPGAASSAREALAGLDRWPLWMWGNEEVLGLAEWLKAHNDQQTAGQKVGLYGMDVYDEWRSKEVLLDFLSLHHEEMYENADELLDCFNRFWGDSWAYAQSVARRGVDCAPSTQELVSMMRNRRSDIRGVDDYEYFYAMQNALVIKYAERFYREAVTRQDASSWNSRAGYMQLTVSRLLELYGENAKGIVWAHNTHIGDARFSEMHNRRQENIGQMSRLAHGEDSVLLVGFGTYTGTVKAAESWGAPIRKMNVPPAGRGSLEHILMETGQEQFMLVFSDQDRTHELFSRPLGNRAIGVTYNPDNDRHQYVNTIVPLRYDAFVFFRETEALRPLAR